MITRHKINARVVLFVEAEVVAFIESGPRWLINVSGGGAPARGDLSEFGQGRGASERQRSLLRSSGAKIYLACS